MYIDEKECFGALFCIFLYKHLHILKKSCKFAAIL